METVVKNNYCGPGVWSHTRRCRHRGAHGFSGVDAPSSPSSSSSTIPSALATCATDANQHNGTSPDVASGKERRAYEVVVDLLVDGDDDDRTHETAEPSTDKLRREMNSFDTKSMKINCCRLTFLLVSTRAQNCIFVQLEVDRGSLTLKSENFRSLTLNPFC